MAVSNQERVEALRRPGREVAPSDYFVLMSAQTGFRYVMRDSAVGFRREFDFRLPGEATDTIRVLLCSNSGTVAVPLRRLTQHDDSIGDAWVELYETATGYLVRFTRVADFEILRDNTIVFSPQSDIPQHTIEHLLHDHVIPRVIAHERHTVLHAAAVEVNGHAIAFLGDTGWGKSTLTASFWRAGYALVSDDCVVISNKEPITAAGIYPGMRLWPDSVLAVGVPADESTPMAHYSSKRRIVVDAEQDGVQTAPVPLQQVYLLASPDDDVTTISITETLPHERVIHYLEHAFRLDPTDRARNAAEFERLTQLAERLPMYRLQYPRRYDVLPDVRTAILAHVASTP